MYPGLEEILHSSSILCTRQRDVIHILYLILQKMGRDPSSVDEVWSLDQSLVRRDKRLQDLESMQLLGRKPAIPGFRGKSVADSPLLPCICPNSALWLNRHKRFLSGKEFLRLQFMMVPHACLSRPERLQKSAAGNGFSGTVVMS
jgi:hypothetical protein